MKLSNILLIIGMVILAVGAVLAMTLDAPYSDYVLITGAVVIIIRGFIRSHERDDR